MTFSCDKDQALLLAAYNGDLNALCVSIKDGANVNCKDLSGYTPLHWISFMGLVGTERVEMAQRLIKAGADVNSFIPEHGPSILSSACEAGNIEIIKLLVENGADINDDKDGVTPLAHAIYFGDIEIVKYLLSRGADPMKKTSSGKSPHEIAIASGRDEIGAFLKQSVGESIFGVTH